MKTGIPEFLPIEKQNELQELVDLITANHNQVNTLILFGSYARDTWVEDRYRAENGTNYSYISDYDIMVLVSSESRAKRVADGLEQTIQRKIQRESNIKTPVNLIFHGYDYFNCMTKENMYFFVDVYREGYILANPWDRELKAPAKISYKLRVEKSIDYFEEWFESAKEFLIDYGHAYNRESLKNASFYLHQATERFFMTTLLVFTDYKPKLHDLNILYEDVCKLDEQFKVVFPLETEEEKRLFKLLRDAYIDSRYKKEFKVEKEELEYLLGRIKLLQEMTEKICNEKIEKFKSYIK